MQTKEQIEEIARLANTTPEIVKAVLSAHAQVRYTFAPELTINAGSMAPAATMDVLVRHASDLNLSTGNCLHCGEPVRGLENAPEIAVHCPGGSRMCVGQRTFADFA